jgi:putative hydrolase of the HAD superfamily
MARRRVSEGPFEAAFFDFGGVLTNPVWDSFAAFLRQEGLDPDTIKRLFREDPEALALLRRLETGSIAEPEFERAFGEKIGLRNHERLIDSMFAGMTPDEEMISAVRELRRGGVHTGLISNSWSVDHYDRDLLEELFEEVVISAEVHLHKPQPEIYLLAAERLRVEPRACLFVDDLRENCEGAEAVGMTAIRHRSTEKTRKRLAVLTGVRLTASPSAAAAPADTSRGGKPPLRDTAG